MGLDQYAYTAARAGQYEEFWDSGDWDKATGDYVNPNVSKPVEIAYWRKHPNLQGWMENLWRSKGGNGTFNGVELELTREDLEVLEQDILAEQVSSLGTEGFFFGDPSDDYYREQDLEFIKEAKADLFMGLKVFYNSSW